MDVLKRLESNFGDLRQLSSLIVDYTSHSKAAQWVVVCMSTQSVTLHCHSAPLFIILYPRSLTPHYITSCHHQDHFTSLPMSPLSHYATSHITSILYTTSHITTPLLTSLVYFTPLFTSPVYFTPLLTSPVYFTPLLTSPVYFTPLLTSLVWPYIAYIYISLEVL